MFYTLYGVLISDESLINRQGQECGNKRIRDQIYTRVVVQITMNGSCYIGSIVERILKLSVVTESYFIYAISPMC